MIAIVDSGGANLASVTFAIERLGKAYKFTADPEEIMRATHVILPGVGTAAVAMDILRRRDLVECLVGLKQPVLGICLGMQLLFSWSAEGEVDMLGLLPGRIEKFNNRALNVPHMGWNTLSIVQKNPLLKNIPEQSYLYFVHSYRAPIGDFTAATTDYGGLFSSVVQHDNFFGCQFHPERSGANGAQILQNFTAL